MKLKRAIVAVLAMAGLGVSLVTTGTAQAVTCPPGSLYSGDKPTYAECNIDSNATADTLLSTVRNVINVVLGILGVVAVVVIIMGGISFMTSQGDAARVAKGRNTILWGVIGLVVSLLAFTIVNLVLRTVDGSSIVNTNPDPNDPGNNIQPF